jgi:adenosyl cobinamide kinase/adenosyl cobinamide phosphate guanylyltransferase
MIALENLAKEKLTLIPPKKIKKLKGILKEKIISNEVGKMIKYPHLVGKDFEDIDSLMMYVLIKEVQP